MKRMGLYIHIPFCRKKCAYCDFLSWRDSKENQSAYVQALLREIEGIRKEEKRREISGIFIGGGTPSILEGRQIEQIMAALYKSFSILKEAEISIEINPKTVDEEKLLSYKRAGINRLSFGLQSTIEEELKIMGRIHSYEDFEKNYFLARRAGFTNINVDLMMAVPKQTKKSWEQSLKRVAALAPEHISAYSLIIEEGTPFYDMDYDFPEETERQMYEETKEYLGAYGYGRYEISNYSKAGYECRHNIGYWQRDEYLGLGLGSSSLFEEVRWKNTDDFSDYIKNSAKPDRIRGQQEYLSLAAQMEETFFLGLRMSRGVSKSAFFEKFHRSPQEAYREQIEKMKGEGLLQEEGDFLYLTERGISLSNYVMAEFLEPKLE